MNRALLAVRLILGTLTAVATLPAHATNGYFMHGIGTHNKAMAGAGMASPTQAIDAATNPASGVLVEERLDAGLAIFSPRREYASGASLANGNGGAFTLGGGAQESDNKWFPIPYVAKNWRLSAERALTLSFFGRGGMNTEWTGGSATFDPDGPGPAPVTTFPGAFGAGEAGVDLSQAFLELAYSVKRGPVAVGLAPVFAVQRFEAKGLRNFSAYTRTCATAAGCPPDISVVTNLTNQGYSWSYGAGVKVGLTWQATDQVALSFVHQTKTWMTDFDEYSDLFAQGGGFDIPSSTRGGIAFKPVESLTLNADLEYTRYSQVKSVGNALALVAGCPTAQQGGTNVENCGGGEDGFGFGWDDVLVVKVGAAWQPASLPEWTFRGGMSVANQPVNGEDALVNILAPGVIDHHITAGASYARRNGDEINFSLMFAPENTVTGRNAFDPTQNIELSMKQFEFEFGYSWR